MAFWAVIGVLGVTAQGAISFFRKPNWAAKTPALNENWRRIAIYSTLAGLLFLAADFALILTNGFHPYSLAFSGVIAFVLFQSLITDLHSRYVDRWIMRVANLSCIVAGIYLLANYYTEAEVVIFIVFALVATALLFVPTVGDADARAFQTVVFALFPLYALSGIKLALIGMIIAIFVYYIGYAIYKKQWAFKSLFTKMSFPMVPLILAPVLVVILFGRWLPML